MKKRSKQELSLDAIRELLYAALRALSEHFWPREVFPSSVIYEDESEARYYRRSWGIIDGSVTLGDEVTEVERKWVEKRAAQAAGPDGIDETAEIRATLGQAKNPEGSAWEVVIAEPGATLNGWYFGEEVLRASEALFEGVDANLYDLPKGGGVHVPDALFSAKKLLVRKKAGWIDNVRYTAGVGLTGVLHFLDSFKWLGKNLLKAADDGHAPYGLSLDCPARAKMDTIDGKKLWRAVKILAADSVDIVTRPAAGGKFKRAVAAQDGEDPMKKKLIKLIQKKRPDLLEGVDLDTITDEEVERRAAMAMEPVAAKNGGGKEPGGGDKDNLATKDDLAILRCEQSLDRALDGCDLPKLAKDRIRRAFMGRIFEPDELTQAIGYEKDYLAAHMQAPEDPVPGGTVVVMGLESVERAQMAVDKLFGLTGDDLRAAAALCRLDNRPFFDDPVLRSTQAVESFDEVPAFGGIREMYTFFTGDHEVTGQFMPKKLPLDRRASMDITSATFSYVLGNTMGRRLVRAYNAADFMENLLISVRKPAKDFRQQEAVLVGGFGDLDDVDPEADDYDEIAGVTDEEATYTVGQKGNVLTVTRKTIINDDISIVTRLVDGFGRAARRTFAQFVWNFFINNSSCTDGTAWFTSGHGNLGATALSFATALTAFKALAKMTEKDSGKRIGWLGSGLKPVLVHPVDLMETGDQIVNDDYYYSSDDLTTKTRNPLKGKISGAMPPLLTDTNDWGLLMPPPASDMVEIGFLNGRQEPEMFLADGPTSEQVFVADKIRHKIRHEYGGTVVDYRTGYKAVVA